MGEGVFFIFDDAFGAGRSFDARFFGEVAADCFVAQRIHRARAGADETDVAAFADFGEVGVLGKETVAGMNRIHIRHFRRADRKSVV